MQVTIETTSTTDRAITLSGGLHILTHCKITGAYNAGDHQTTLIQNTNGALYIRAGSNIDIDRAGPGVIRALYISILTALVLVSSEHSIQRVRQRFILKIAMSILNHLRLVRRTILSFLMMHGLAELLVSAPVAILTQPLPAQCQPEILFF